MRFGKLPYGSLYLINKCFIEVKSKSYNLQTSYKKMCFRGCKRQLKFQQLRLGLGIDYYCMHICVDQLMKISLIQDMFNSL